MKKILSFVLTIVLLTTAIPLYAAEETSVLEEPVYEVESSETELPEEEIDPDEYSIESDLNAEESDSDTEEELIAEEESVDSEMISAEYQSALNFIYVESPLLNIPNTQRVVLAFGEEIQTENIQALKVVKEDELPEDAATWGLSRAVDGLCLFEQDFPDDIERGVYYVVGLEVTEGEETIDVSLLDYDICFGIEEEYDGYEDLMPLDGETAVDTGDLDIAVLNLDEDGTVIEESSIVEALENAEVSTDTETSDGLKNTIDPVADVHGICKTINDTFLSHLGATNGNIIVALDPGHDSTHTGASGHGSEEYKLNLKIAQYCKTELESYNGISVYMTRTSDACPNPGTSSAGADIAKRVQAAKNAGASVYVSIHLNAWETSSPHGAEVYIPNDSWKAQQNVTGKNLADAILTQLVALGLSERGIYSRDCTTGDTYADGSIEDYYAVQYNGKLLDLPGIIVEHAFISNDNDYNQYLSSDEGLKKLGVADATGIANYFGLSKAGNRATLTEGTYTFVSALNSDRVLNVTNASVDNGAQMTLGAKSNTSGQRFELLSTGNGCYQIIAECSGKALQVNGGVGDIEEFVTQQEWNSTLSNQQWSFIDAGGGYYYVQSNVGSYLDIKYAESAIGTPIWTYTYNGSNAQKWKLVACNEKPLSDGVYSFETASKTNLMMEIGEYAVSNSVNIQVGIKDATPRQAFRVKYQGGGYYQILNEYSGFALDVSGASKTNGANVQQYGWNGTNAQLWKFVDAGDGTYYLRAKIGSVATVAKQTPGSGTNVYAWASLGGASQRWKVSTADLKSIPEGDYVFKSKMNSSRILSYSGTNIQLASDDESEAAVITVKYVSDGYYKLILKQTGNVLDVQYAEKADGTNLWQYEWNGSDAQLWRFLKTGDSYFIQSKLGTVIDVRYAESAPGTNIWLYSNNDSSAQKWTLEDGITVSRRTIDDGVYVIANSTNTKQVLEVAGASFVNLANVQSYEYNGGDHQKFQVTYLNNGYYKITALHSGKVLDVYYGYSSVGTNLQQYESNGSAAQQWKFVDAGNGSYYIQSKLGTIIDLSANTARSGLNAYMEENEHLSSQKWIFKKASEMGGGSGTTEGEVISGGLYTIVSAMNNNLALDIESASTISGANAQIYQRNGTGAQKFNVVAVGDGYYKILNYNSGCALDIVYGSPATGTNVWQYLWNGSDAQLWKFVDAGGGYYYIQSKLGTVLDIRYAETASGTNVWAYQLNMSNAQKWKLVDPSFTYVTNTEGAKMTKAQLFTWFRNHGLTNAGAAGLMGNLIAESDCNSNNLQGTYERSLGYSDESYTNAVDQGLYTNFVYDKAGYGLAQWTYWSRKQELLDYCRSKGTSIGNAQMQCEYLIKELQSNHRSVWNILTTTNSIREASDAVLLQYEQPADQSTAVQLKRANYGQDIYNLYAY